jgi:MFS family permease
MCSASSLVSWLIIFFLNGSAMGALSIAVQYLAQTPSNPRTVAGGFSSMVISSTSAQILGGMIGALIFLSFSNTIQQAYIFVFLTSALVRCMAILMPKAIKADETEDLFTESEALQEAI